MLSFEQISKMDTWMLKNARPYDLAKWNFLNEKGTNEEIVTEMLKFQNSDGGFGNGFECDILLPLSAAIPSAEAIFQCYDYDLDCNSMWFKNLLNYFENTVMDIPKYWEDIPYVDFDYPRAPWWNYDPGLTFSPNPCGVIASALIKYGTDSQKELGYKIAKDCIKFLFSDADCHDHDCLNLIALIEKLLEINSPLITDEVVEKLGEKISICCCYDEKLWDEYRFAPLDFVDSKDSKWYDTVKSGIKTNLKYYKNTINEEGVWNPNFSWGVDSETSRQVTENWKGYIACKRFRMLKRFGLL